MRAGSLIASAPPAWFLFRPAPKHGTMNGRRWKIPEATCHCGRGRDKHSPRGRSLGGVFGFIRMPVGDNARQDDRLGIAGAFPPDATQGMRNYR